MNDLLPYVGTSTYFGLNWPAWIAAGGFLLFCLLGLYAASLLLAGDRLPVRLKCIQLPTLRGRMLMGFILAGTLPAISLALVLSERTTGERVERSAAMLESQAANVAGVSDYFIQKAARDLEMLGQRVMRDTVNDSTSFAEQLRRSHGGSPGFTTLVAANRKGAVVAATRISDRQAEIIEDPIASIGDRDYFLQPMKSGEVYYSNIIEDPAVNTAPTIVISIPLRNPDGADWGVLAGTYHAAHFSRLQINLGDRGAIQSLLLDRNGRLIFATAQTDFRPFENLTGKSVLSVQLPGEGELFSFERTTGDNAHENFLAIHYRLQNGWKVFLFRSMHELEFALLDEFGVTLIWLAATLLITICLALAIVNGISGPLEAVDKSVRDFQLNVKQEPLDPPANAPSEVLSIFDHLASLDKRLTESYQKLRKALKAGEKLRGELIFAISNREREVEKRTEELKEANETLQRLSREDSLTGLANRRWFAEFLARTWQSAMRNKAPISILIIDIDDFKAYNDNYGHQKGDDCLRIVSDTIRRIVGRASDLVSRYGGEEFVVVLGDTALEGGLKIAENIRTAVENLGLRHKGAQNHSVVTVSIGVTSTLPAPDVQPTTILVAADRAMYIAKQEGKNQIAYSTAVGTGVYQALCLPSNTESRPC